MPVSHCDPFADGTDHPNNPGNLYSSLNLGDAPVAPPRSPTPASQEPAANWPMEAGATSQSDLGPATAPATRLPPEESFAGPRPPSTGYSAASYGMPPSATSYTPAADRGNHDAYRANNEPVLAGRSDAAEPAQPSGRRGDSGATSIPNNFPPVVYLPTMTHVDRVEDARIMLRQMRDGRVACLAYSALDRLLTCCGDDQPWMWTPTVALDSVQQDQPFDVLLLDIHIPDEHRGSFPS